MIMVRAGGDVQVFAPTADRGLSSLFPEDARAIEKEIPNVALVSGTQIKRGINLVYEDRSAVTRIFGVEPNWADIRHRSLIAGEFISSADIASMARVTVLGDTIAKALFPEGGAVGLLEGQWPEQHTVDDTEYRRVGADAQREREYDGESESGRRAQLPHCVDDVLPQVPHEFAPAMRRLGRPIDSSDVVACILEIAELTHGFGARRVGAHAKGAELLDAHVEVESQLLVDILANVTTRPPWQTKETAGHWLGWLEHFEDGFGVSPPPNSPRRSSRLP